MMKEGMNDGGFVVGVGEYRRLMRRMRKEMNTLARAKEGYVTLSPC